jgi:elongation factor P--(R)-beta-lysine ligase
MAVSESRGPERFALRKDDLKNYRFLLQARDQIRSWLNRKGYLEAMVPTLSPETVPDLNLESFEVEFKSAFTNEPGRRLFLQTSPELLLKRMLAAGFERIFYLGPVFRQGEFAERHHPEFFMAEWYRAGINYLDLMKELEQMLGELFKVKTPVPKFKMRDALNEASGIDFLKLQDKQALAAAIKQRDPSFRSAGLDWVDLFEFAVVEWLQPWLEKQDAVFIHDWPAQTAMQGKLKLKDRRVAERFELYLRGTEVANGYTESTDAAEMEKRFRAEVRKRKRLGRMSVPLPGKFLKTLRSGMPGAAGVSLGLERLCLALLGLDDLDRLMAFREI